MPKGKQRGNREVKKPKQAKKPAAIKDTFLRPTAAAAPAKPRP